MNSKFFILVMTMLLFNSCTNRQLYEATQRQPDDVGRCIDLVGPQYDECMEREGMTYDTYKKTREEALKQEK